jgi:hypothetical protein
MKQPQMSLSDSGVQTTFLKALLMKDGYGFWYGQRLDLIHKSISEVSFQWFETAILAFV